MQNSKLKKTISVGIFLTLLFFGVQVFSQNIKLNSIKPVKNTALTDEQQAVLAVRTVKASVVNIIAYKDVSNAQGELKNVDSITGTGIIIEPNGTIMSNSHVVEDTNLKYFVVFADGSTYDAKVLGQDLYNDVALLKIEANNLIAAKLGDSDNLETGQSVFAIGNSLGRYQNTVTRGVVSGLSRSVSVSDFNDKRPRMLNLIQTDAAINPGNSGGPLVNMVGEVIGINTLIDTEAQGVGFAVPINVVKNSVSQLKAFGKVSKPYLGISFQTIDPAVQKLRGLDVKDGAYILEVVANGPAAFAKLQPKDIVVEINREKLTQNKELDQIVTRYKAGDQILITYIRNGQKMDVPLVLAEFK
jgi:serine protease Do